MYQKHCRGLTPSSMAASMISDSMDFIATIKIKIENPIVSITQLQGIHKMQLVFHPTGQEILVRCLMQLSQHKLPEVLKEQGRTDKVFLVGVLYKLPQ